VGEGVGWCHSFVLHLCPIPNLDFDVFGMTTTIAMTRTVAAVAAALTTATSWAVLVHA
jgi:hypothetical protein